MQSMIGLRRVNSTDTEVAVYFVKENRRLVSPTGIVNFWEVRNRIPTFKNANNTKPVEVIHFCHFCYTPVTPVGAVVKLYCRGWHSTAPL